VAPRTARRPADHPDDRTPSRSHLVDDHRAGGHVMPETTVTLPNPSGLHARPAKVFAKAASASPAEVTVAKDGNVVNAKSVLSVLTLDCHHGDAITIAAEGDGADEIVAELAALVEGGLGEGSA
jgi:phosphocarrier protein HPr